MTVQSQTANNSDIIIRTGLRIRVAQKLTLADRQITNLSFLLRKVGSPSGDVTFAVRKVSDDSVIESKVWGDAGSLPTSNTWEEVVFDTAAYVNEQIRICCEFGAGDGSNYVVFRYQNTDVAADENMSWYPASSWTEGATWDAAYSFTHTGPPPTVTTQPVSAIQRTTATGHGTLVATGDPTPTQHGHCWNTTGTPTTADPKTELGAIAAPGTFTSSLTGLQDETTYYVRAYATNDVGTSYGSEVTFVTGPTEEQIENDDNLTLYSGGPRTRGGQRLFIINRWVEKLQFLLLKENSPAGDVTFTIRRVSDDSVITSKVWGDASTLPTSSTWEEVEFDTPVLINEEVRILAEWAGGPASDDYVHIRRKNSDVKAGEEETHYLSSTWYEESDKDTAYRYYYEPGTVGGLAPGLIGLLF